MSEFCRKNGHSFLLRRRIHSRVSLLRRCILRALHRLLSCSGKQPGANATYSILTPNSTLSSPPAPLLDSHIESAPPPVFHAHELDTDLVSLKISLLGDCQIGKTSFLVSLWSQSNIFLFILYIFFLLKFDLWMGWIKEFWLFVFIYYWKNVLQVKYVGNEKEQGGELKRKGPNQMDKTLVVSGARISYCIWEVQGIKVVIWLFWYHFMIEKKYYLINLLHYLWRGWKIRRPTSNGM